MQATVVVLEPDVSGPTGVGPGGAGPDGTDPGGHDRSAHPASRPTTCALCDRVERLLGSPPRHRLIAGGEDTMRQLAAIIRDGTEPLVLVDPAFAGHDSAMVDVAAHEPPGCAVLTGVGGEAEAVRVRAGVVTTGYGTRPEHAGGVLRLLGDERMQVAHVLERSTPPGDGVRPLAVVLTAAVTAGIRVHAVPRGQFHAAVEPDARRRTDLDLLAAQVDEHRLRLHDTREVDGHYSRFVVQRAAHLLTAVAVRTRVTPNQVSLAATGLAVLAAALFATGAGPAVLAAAVLLQVSLVVDRVDHELARYTRSHFEFGVWLSAGTGRFKEVAVYAGLATGAARGGDQVWTLVACLVAVQMVHHFVGFGFSVRQTARAQRIDLGRRPPRQQVPGAALGRAAADLRAHRSVLGAVRWARRTLAMPIGERWLVLGVVTVGFGPRAALGTLLILSVIAAAYTIVTQMLRTLADAVQLNDSQVRELVIAADLGRWRDSSAALKAKAPLGWLVPAASRGIEYGAVLVVVGLEWVSPTTGTWYLLVLSLWHHDLWYRLRCAGAPPAGRVRTATVGALGRTAVIGIAAMAAPLAGTVIVSTLAAWVAGCGLLDGVIAWRRWHARPTPVPKVPPFRVLGSA